MLHLLNRAADDALRGHEASCRLAAAQAALSGRRLGLLSVEIAATHVLGLLELSKRNLEVAVWHLTTCDRMASARSPLRVQLVRHEPDLVEVLVALGRRDEARMIAAAFADRAERLSAPWSIVAAARCRGLVAGDSAFDAPFREAAVTADAMNAPFERARAELCFGERLRRARRRVEARAPLASALQTFREAAAQPWSERAARELSATSATVRRRGDPSTIDDLTPQERAVAELVAAGATVRGAAAKMFISPKTVEAHLGRAYRKLGVHNRAQLARTMAQEERVEAAAA